MKDIKSLKEDYYNGFIGQYCLLSHSELHIDCRYRELGDVLE